MKISDSVENFSLVDQYNNASFLFDNLGNNVLLVFYPKNNTPVCTKQLVDYSVNQQELRNFGLILLDKHSTD